MFIALAIAASLAAAPDAAARRGLDATAATVVAPPEGGSGAPVEGRAATAQPTRYCVMADVTGSRIPRKECRTRSEWLDHGFDPLEKN